MRPILFALFILGQLGFAESRYPLAASNRFTPKTDIIYQQSKAEVFHLACDGFETSDGKQRIFSVKLVDRYGNEVFSHSMDSRTLEKELVCNYGFSIDQITEFRDVMCTAQSAIALDPKSEITYRNVMEAAIKVARERQGDDMKRVEDKVNIGKILHGGANAPDKDPAGKGAHGARGTPVITRP